MKIINYGFNSREWFKNFERVFYSKLAPRLKPSYKNCLNILGKSISFFVFEHNDIRNLCLFDLDDGSGLKEDSCKIKYDFLEKFMEENHINDYLIFKSQLNKHYPYFEFYKDIDKTVPLGYFPDNLKALLKYKKKKKYLLTSKNQKQKDIDVFWLGTVKNDMGEGMIWPKNLNLKYWNYGKRIAGFKALQEISKKRTDLKIICSDKKVPLKNYFELISRSKICFDFVGVGEFTKRFVECVILEKCVMSFKKLQEFNFQLRENIHYISIEEGDDIDYTFTSGSSSYPNSYSLRNIKIKPKRSLINKLEYSIDEAINNPDLIENIEKNVSKIQKYFTFDFITSYIKEKSLEYFFSKR
ncbi:MAG: hypothetical protein ACFFAO_17390 [Candidatus Hermodarchaeota archaeon]